MKKQSPSVAVADREKTQAENVLDVFEKAVREQLAAKDLSHFEGLDRKSTRLNSSHT